MKKYFTGAIKSDTDKRDIKLADVATLAVKSDLPKSYKTDISMIPVLNQKALGACVGHAFATQLMYLNFKETKQKTLLSPRYMYALAKAIDGITTEGTQPRVVAKIVTSDTGCAVDSDVPNDTDLPHAEYVKIKVSATAKKVASMYKGGGYAFAQITQDGLKQAIHSNGVICIAMKCGTITSKTIKAGDTNGGHYVALFGYKDKANGDTEFYYRNSWSKDWGNNGDGSFLWSEFTAKYLYDAIAIADVPNIMINIARAGWKHFKATEKTGESGTIGDLQPELVDMLDKARDIAGIPFKINSGFRSAERNEMVGGVKDSAHTKGYAVDIQASTGADIFKIVSACLQVGFKRIGISFTANFVHVDIDPSKPQGTFWGYPVKTASTTKASLHNDSMC